MISVSQALTVILDSLTPLSTRKLPLTGALGFITAEEVRAPRNLPPRDNSAMDGYVFRYEDAADAGLQVVGAIAAGGVGVPVGPGQAQKIMTGAPLPDGGDTVIPVEQTRAEGNMVFFTQPVQMGANIRAAGEDVGEGQLVIPAGCRIRPAEVGMLAALGRSFVSVRTKPRVAVLATGDEIVEIDEHDKGNKIVNSNSYGLAAQLVEAGAEPVMLGIGRDDPDGLMEMLEQSEGCDMVLTTGGVSMGDYDFVPEVFERWSVDVRVRKVAMKPGKPVVFGMRGKTAVFGLPGNPVSAMVGFEQFVRPAIRYLSGSERLYRPVVSATLTEEAGLVKAKAGRMEFVRCTVEVDEGRYLVTSTKKRGSGMLSTLVEANGLLVVPEDSKGYAPGEEVLVQLYDYEFLEGCTPGWAALDR